MRRAKGYLLGLWLLAGSLAVARPIVATEQVVDVAFTARADGAEQKYALLLPDGFDPHRRHDVLIALHGHGSNRWQFVRDPRDECRAARDVARERRLVFVSPDYRAPTNWMGPKAEADLVQILDDLRLKYKIGKAFVCGGSMGGSAALTFAVLHPDRLAGVAALNGVANHLEYTQFQGAIADSFGGTRQTALVEYKRRSAEYWPERLTMPMGLTTGGKDAITPPDGVLRLAQVLKSMGREVLVIHRPDSGHATGYADARAVLEFVIERSAAAQGSAPSPGK